MGGGNIYPPPLFRRPYSCVVIKLKLYGYKLKLHLSDNNILYV